MDVINGVRYCEATTMPLRPLLITQCREAGGYKSSKIVVV